MKQNIINGIVITAIIVVMVALLFPWPKDFNKEFIGIKYQLGEKNQIFSEPVKVIFNGKFHESYFGLLKDRFTGNINIDGVNIYRNNRFELSFNDEKTTVIVHKCFIPIKSTHEEYFYGKLYFNENMDSLVIELFDDSSIPSFSKSDGIIIAAPAKSKEEAVKIVENLVNE